MAKTPSRRIEGPPALWDPVVRLSHWALALIVLMNAILTDGGSLVHVTAGWVGMAFLLLRLIWGLTGPTEARFSSFPPNPAAALAHLGDMRRGRVREYPSHNPAGAAMVYLLWGLLAVVMLTGLVMTSAATPFEIAAEKAAVDSGDWSALVKGDGFAESAGDDGAQTSLKHIAEEVHIVAANLILVFVVLHLAGVAAESFLTRRNLTAAMISGRHRNTKGK